MDLRLQEVEKLFPEGLAGGSCGGLERATSRGTPAALLRREAADALIMTLDGYAEAGPPGIKGTSSEQWRARNSGVKTGVDAAQEGGDVVGLGGAETATADAVAAVATPAEAGAGAETAEEGGEEKKDKVLGSGPIWEEMKALAESKRKPLKGVRPVTVQPGQVRVFVRGCMRACVKCGVVCVSLCFLCYLQYRWSDADPLEKVWWPLFAARFASQACAPCTTPRITFPRHKTVQIESV